MKNKKVHFLITIVCLFLNVWIGVAGITPPPPGGGPPPPGGPPAPLGFPIDENIMTAVVIAVFFGLYIVYKQHQKQKTPM